MRKQKSKWIALLAVLALFSSIFGLATVSAAPQAPVFFTADAWTQHSTNGTVTAQNGSITFGNTGTDQIWNSWGEWGRLFAYTYEEPLNVSGAQPAEFKFKIDEFTSENGRLLLTFDYSDTLHDPLCMFEDWGGERVDASGKTVVLYALKGQDGAYEFRTCRATHDMVHWKDEDPASAVIKPDADGYITVAYDEISFILQGENSGNIDMRWVYTYMDPAVAPINNEVAPYFTVMALEKSNPLATDKKMTVTFAAESNEVKGWTENSAHGFIEEKGEYTAVSHLGYDVIWADWNEWRQMFSYTKDNPVVYGDLALSVKINQMPSVDQKLVFALDFTETKQNPLNEIGADKRDCSGKSLLFFLEPISGEADSYTLYTVRTNPDRIVWEEERGRITVTPDENGYIEIRITGNMVAVGEQEYDISGIIDLGNPIDTTLYPYFSVIGLEKNNTPSNTTMSAEFKLDVLTDPCLPEAGENPITGEMEFVNSEWGYWNGQGAQVNFALTDAGYSAAGKSTEGSSLAAYSYNEGLDLSKAFKFSFTADKVYPTTDSQYCTINFIISTQARQLLNASSVWLRVSFPTGDAKNGGSAALVVSDFTNPNNGVHTSNEAVAFAGSESGEVVVALVPFNGDYRLYVNGTFVSGEVNRVMSSVINNFGDNDVYFSAISIFEGLAQNLPEGEYPPLPVYDEPVAFTLTSFNGNKIVNRVPDLSTADAPEKPSGDAVTKDSVTIKWTTPTLNVLDAAKFEIGGYIIERFDSYYNGSNKDNVPDKVFYITDLSKLEYTDTGLTSESRYFYTIYAVDDASDPETMIKLVKFGQVSATTLADEKPGPGGDDDGKDGGCGGCSGSAAIASVLFCAAALVIKRRH